MTRGPTAVHAGGENGWPGRDPVRPVRHRRGNCEAACTEVSVLTPRDTATSANRFALNQAVPLIAFTKFHVPEEAEQHRAGDDEHDHLLHPGQVGAPNHRQHDRQLPEHEHDVDETERDVEPAKRWMLSQKANLATTIGCSFWNVRSRRALAILRPTS